MCRFAYKGSAAPVLHEINLDVQPGEMIALVGPSGAGKTTLCNLIARFYDPTAGAVLLDGIDLRNIDVPTATAGCWASSSRTRFSSTAPSPRTSPTAGATRRSKQIIEAAATGQRPRVHRRTARGGYDTLIGERGVKLSGGQRQRLTIARAILADPRILILDEATSNLDTESERLIQASLHTLMAGRTSFVIAHRLSTIAHASRILVLENGRTIGAPSPRRTMYRSPGCSMRSTGIPCRLCRSAVCSFPRKNRRLPPLSQSSW